MEQAYRAIVDTAGRRRHATQQIIQGYLVLLSSHFQRFCRDLHSEAAGHLLRSVDPKIFSAVYGVLITGRKLDQGNPNPGNLGADFGRLGMSFWPDVKALHVRNERRLALLESMVRWRNAIAHQDFASQAQALGHRTEVTLSEVRTFRRACNELARSFDRAVGTFIEVMVGPGGGW